MANDCTGRGCIGECTDMLPSADRMIDLSADKIVITLRNVYKHDLILSQVPNMGC